MGPAPRILRLAARATGARIRPVSAVRKFVGLLLRLIDSEDLEEALLGFTENRFDRIVKRGQ